MNFPSCHPISIGDRLMLFCSHLPPTSSCGGTSPRAASISGVAQDHNYTCRGCFRTSRVCLSPSTDTRQDESLNQINIIDMYLPLTVTYCILLQIDDITNGFNNSWWCDMLAVCSFVHQHLGPRPSSSGPVQARLQPFFLQICRQWNGLLKISSKIQ